jgi:hypothetical protein
MLNEDKAYIIWTLNEESRVSEILFMTQNWLLAEEKVDEYNEATDDPVYVDTIVAGVKEHIDPESREEYPDNVYIVGGSLRIERGF